MKNEIFIFSFLDRISFGISDFALPLHKELFEAMQRTEIRNILYITNS